MNLRKVWNKIRDGGPHKRLRFVVDYQIAVGTPRRAPSYVTDLDKEEISRRYVLGRTPSGEGRMRFLDVGGRDGKLSYLLGNVAPLKFDTDAYERNIARFQSLYDYYGVDLHPAGYNVLAGDICDTQFLDQHANVAGSFDIVYSNNVFEHFRKPWIAAEVILRLLKPGGICITIVPFAQRYHEDPGDYFRYTPTGMVSLFEQGDIAVLEAGFDIRARRYDWQGSGEANDVVPTDGFGAWRETWYTLVVIQKQAGGRTQKTT